MKRLIRENWVLAFVMLLTVLYIITGFIFKNRFDVFTFPFQSDVHGALSDWVMVCVTAVTAHYFWKTLQSQMDVQRMQKSLYDIEEFKFIQSVKPTFSVAHRLVPPASGLSPRTIRFFIGVTCDKNKAIDVTISAWYKFHTHDIKHVEPIKRVEMEGEEMLEVFRDMALEIPNNNRFHLSAQVVVDYFDVKRIHRYKQFFEFSNRRTMPMSFDLVSKSPPIQIAHSD